MAGDDVEWEQMIGEYRDMIGEYKVTIAELREDRNQNRESIQALTQEVSNLTEQLKASKKGEYLPADNDILFDELLSIVNDHIKGDVPESIRKEIEGVGLEVNIDTVFGPDRLNSTFCTTYQNALAGGLYVDVPKEGAVLIDAEVGVTDETLDTTWEWVDSKCKEYTAEVEEAKRAGRGVHKGVWYDVGIDKDRITDMLAGMKKLTPQQKDDLDFVTGRFDALKTVKSRVTAYLQGGGLFILYRSLRGIPISEVTAKTVVQFQDVMEDNINSAPETLNKYARDQKILFDILESDEYMPDIPRKGRGSIPTRHYEVGATKKKPHTAFELTMNDNGSIDHRRCEVCSLYRCIRDPDKVGKKFSRDRRKLIEICMRILNETGLRRKFLLNIQWGDFTSTPVMKMPKGQPVYQLRLERIRDLVRHTKQLPDKDMYISGLLGSMIQSYLGSHTEILSHHPVYNAMLLLGPYRDRTLGTVINEATWRNKIVIPIREVCGIDASPMKFRNTYYTIMLSALEYPVDKAFKQWTGDREDTAEKNYQAATGVIRLPDDYTNALSYPEIVTHIFGKMMVWDAHLHKWK